MKAMKALQITSGARDVEKDIPADADSTRDSRARLPAINDEAEADFQEEGGTKSFLSAYDSKDFDVFEKRYLQLARQQASRPSLCGISFAHRSVLLLPVLTPGSWIIIAWTWIMLLIDAFYTCLVFPFTMALMRKKDEYFLIDIVMGVFFCVDVLLHFLYPFTVRCGYYSLTLTNGPGVAWVYVTQGSFITDFLAASALPVSLIITSYDKQSGRNVNDAALYAVLVLRLVRFARMFTVLRTLYDGQLIAFSRNMFRSSWISSATSYLVSLCFITAVIIAVLAAVWLFFGLAPGYEEGTTWLAHVGIQDFVYSSSADQILAAIYFVSTTITTVGYGDIVPHTAIERVIAIFIQLAGAVFLALVIGTIGSILRQRSLKSMMLIRYREQVVWLDSWFVEHKVPKAVERDIYSYLQKIWVRVEGERQLWTEIHRTLPYSLRGHMVYQGLSGPLGRLDLLFEGVPQKQAIELCARLERHALPPETVLCRRGEPANWVWLLQHGTIRVLELDVQDMVDELQFYEANHRQQQREQQQEPPTLQPPPSSPQPPPGAPQPPPGSPQPQPQPGSPQQQEPASWPGVNPADYYQAKRLAVVSAVPVDKLTGEGTYLRFEYEDAPVMGAPYIGGLIASKCVASSHAKLASSLRRPTPPPPPSGPTLGAATAAGGGAPPRPLTPPGAGVSKAGPPIGRGPSDLRVPSRSQTSRMLALGRNSVLVTAVAAHEVGRYTATIGTGGISSGICIAWRIDAKRLMPLLETCPQLRLNLLTLLEGQHRAVQEWEATHLHHGATAGGPSGAAAR